MISQSTQVDSFKTLERTFCVERIHLLKKQWLMKGNHFFFFYFFFWDCTVVNRNRNVSLFLWRTRSNSTSFKLKMYLIFQTILNLFFYWLLFFFVVFSTNRVCKAKSISFNKIVDIWFSKRPLCQLSHEKVRVLWPFY